MAMVKGYADYRYIVSISKVCGNCKLFVQHYGLADERVCIPIFCGGCKAKSIIKRPSDKGCRLFIMNEEEISRKE